MFEKLMNSEVLFRLNQEGYVLLVTLLIVFAMSIFVANVIAQLITALIYLLNFFESIIYGIAHQFSKKETSS